MRGDSCTEVGRRALLSSTSRNDSIVGVPLARHPSTLIRLLKDAATRLDTVPFSETRTSATTHPAWPAANEDAGYLGPAATLACARKIRGPVRGRRYLHWIWEEMRKGGEEREPKRFPQWNVACGPTRTRMLRAS